MYFSKSNLGNAMFLKTLLAITTSALMMGGLTACTNNSKIVEPDSLVAAFNETWAKADEFKGEVKIKSIQKTDSDTFYLVEMEKGGTGYLTADGKYLIGGPVMQLEGNKIVEIGEKAKIETNKEYLSKINLATAITYKPTDTIKHTVYIFTDPSCPACIAFHQETEELLKNGVQIHFLPWARNAESQQIINDVWCAKDKKVAYESAIKSEKFETQKCANGVEEVINIGKKLNVKATPTIFTDKGEVITGAIPAKALLNFLNSDIENEQPVSQASPPKK